MFCMYMNVLLVDDNYICVEGIMHAISWDSPGISSVHTVYDGVSALDYLKNHPVHILISDISMPGMSGLALSEKALALNPSIKIILISAYDEFEYARQAVRLGAFDYIEKPVNYSYLTEILEKVIAEIKMEVKNLEILKKSRPAIAEQFFRSLIQQGNRESAQILELYAHYLDLKLNCRYYIVLHISAADSDLLKQKLGIEEYCVRSMNLEHCVRKICSTFTFHYVLKDLTNFICIIGENIASAHKFLELIQARFQKAAEHFSSRLGVVIGLGNITDSIWELNSSYASAQKALEYRFFFPEQTFLEADAISRYGSKVLPDADVSEENLIQCICKKDMNGITDWIHAFIHSFPGNCDSKIVVYSQLYTIVARLLKFCYELNIMTPEFEKEITFIFTNPDYFKTIAMISDWLLNTCREICQRLQESVSKYHESLCETAVKYILKNYSNSDLGLNEIAESLQISPAYLSTLFKRCRNQNISTFLTDTRIDAACQLLLNTSLSLKVISTQVGYSNQYYFSSCFKKKTGKTPSAYREEYQKQ